MKTRLRLIFLGLLMSLTSYSQTLNAGDIAFIGYVTDAPDAFAFITLTDIPAGEITHFTDRGWAGSVWFGNTEDDLQWTAPGGGVSCGTIVTVTETGADTFNVTTGSIAMSGGYSGFSMSAGDQIIAYRGGSGAHPASPTFIAAVHGDYNAGDYNGATTWNNGVSTINATASLVPTGLTNGDDCVSLYPAPGPERDNNRYTGTLIGTSTALRAAINTPGNWTAGTDSSGIVSINPGDFSTPSVTCIAPCTDPTVPTVTYLPATVCSGGNATLNITGTLNDATAWHVYTGSCGGTPVGTTAGSSIVVTPSGPSTVYYIRGEGGCVTPGTCGSTTVTVTALDDASFSYSAGSYCANDPDPTPTVTGLGGGGFTSVPGGLSINAATGAIDVSTSTPGAYTVTYTTTGTCPNTSNVGVTINAIDDASFSYSAGSYAVDDSDPTPTITGLGGGTFSSTPGLSINAATGAIDVSTSTVAVYTVTYTTAGSCPNSSNVSVEITFSLGVNENVLGANINLYPNPNNGSFTLNYSGQEQLKELLVLDMLGNRVQTLSLENFDLTQEINLTALAKGMYFITIQTNSAKVTKRMIIE